MPALSNKKHEKFAQAVASGVSAPKAYASAGYSKLGASGGSSRLQRNAAICSRIAEIRVGIAKAESEINAKTIALEIGNRNARVQGRQRQHPKNVYEKSWENPPASH